MTRPSHSQATFTGQIVRCIVFILLAFTLLTSILYNLFSSGTFASINAGELRNKANGLTEIITSDWRAGKSEGFSVIRRLNSGLTGGYVLIVDRSGQPLYSSFLPDDISPEMLLGKDLERVFQGEEVISTLALSTSSIQVLELGQPIRLDGNIVGGIFLFKPQYEITASKLSLTMALIVSMITVLIIAVPFTILFIRRISKPVGTMGDIAVRISEGDLDLRADDTKYKEFQQIGHSINNIAQDLKQSIDDLTVERNRVIQILNGISDGIVAFDAVGDITQSNPAILSLLHAETDTAENDDETKRVQHPGRTLKEAIPKEVFDFARQCVCDCRQSDCYLVEAADGFEMREQSGLQSDGVSATILHMVISPITDASGDTVGAVGMVHDITQSERLEQTRREYVANVSHEMRTPLTALRGLIEPMRDGLVTDESARMRYYNIMMRETMRLSRLINDLMELSRLQSGQMSLTNESVRLEPILDDLVEKFRIKADDSDLTFRCSIPEQLPAVMGNGDRIEQVLTILLDNAMKYTPSVREDGTVGCVQLLLEPTTSYLRISVRDNGIGISESDLPHIFERFYKVDKAHTGLGSGLGLSIAHEIVQRMGQSLTVDSRLGEGSVFTLTVRKSGN